MIIIAFLALFLVGVGALFYFWNRFHKFHFVQEIAKEHKKRSWLVAAVPVLILVLLFFLKTVIAVIISLHLLVFWILCDFIAWLIKRFAKKSSEKYFAGIAAILITTVYLCIGWYYGHHVFETHYSVESNKDLGMERLRIVQISDSHLGCTFDGDGFAEYMKRVQKTKPDLVVVTGDFVDDDSKRAEMIKACKALGDLETTYGVYFVYGNHDRGYFNTRDFSADELDTELEKNNVMILKDEMVEICPEILLVGRRDRSEAGRQEMADLVSTDDIKNKYVIVLDHQPHDFDAQEKAGVDLVLCGHTHGGQMFPVGITGELSGENDKTYGLEKRGATTFIVNSGISDWAIPFKTAAIAEYGVIDVVRSE
ncbi:MAG: metallophosphoesterase [Lachnospiraceae bacterium]|nr:metallophosphoesterase [Lachnospiraceae bacterium]